jgi:hypothetical protein
MRETDKQSTDYTFERDDIKDDKNVEIVYSKNVTVPDVSLPVNHDR